MQTQSIMIDADVYRNPRAAESREGSVVVLLKLLLLLLGLLLLLLRAEHYIYYITNTRAQLF